MGDLSSLLMKTGKVMPDVEVQDQLNITEQLLPKPGNPNTTQDEDTMEELEKLMLKLDRVFKGFHDPALIQTPPGLENGVPDPLGIAKIVGDIGDQVHGFSYQFRQDHDL